VEHLIDTSVWVEFLNGRPGKGSDRVEALAQEPDSIVITEPVLMEIRAGATRLQLARIDSVLGRFAVRGVQPARDFHAAGDLYRGARQRGFTVRSMVDCLIAAVAIRTNTVILHRDRDFEVLAAIAPDLRCESTIE
jgi:predicted nucleic acid-binding protein